LNDKSTTTGLPTNLRIIITGRTLYVYEPNLPAFGSVGSTTGPVTSSWRKESLSSSSHNSFLSSFGPMALLQIPASSKALQFEDLGPSMVRGENTTEYQFGVSACQSTTNGITQNYSSAPTTLWIDTRGRFVQGTTAQTVVIRTPKQSGNRTDRLTTSSTVHLFDFDVPVNITAPAAAGSNSGSAAIILFSNDNRCG
jgi:hypothetical protein